METSQRMLLNKWVFLSILSAIVVFSVQPIWSQKQVKSTGSARQLMNQVRYQQNSVKAPAPFRLPDSLEARADSIIIVSEIKADQIEKEKQKLQATEGKNLKVTENNGKMLDALIDKLKQQNSIIDSLKSREDSVEYVLNLHLQSAHPKYPDTLIIKQPEKKKGIFKRKN